MPALFHVHHSKLTAFSLTNSPSFSCCPSPPYSFGSFDPSPLLYPSLATSPLSVVPLQTPEELDDSDFDPEDPDVRSRTSVQTEDDQLIAGQSARVSCKLLLVVFTDITESNVLPLNMASMIASEKWEISAKEIYILYILNVKYVYRWFIH